MRKISKILFSFTFIASLSAHLYSCTKKVTNENEINFNIHDIIKEIAEEPLEFNGDWIFDKEIFDGTINTVVIKNIYEYFIRKTMTREFKNKLINRIPNLYKVYPDFTLSISNNYNNTKNYLDYYDDFVNSLENNNAISWNYEIHYNLRQLQNIPENVFLKKLPWRKEMSNILALYGGPWWGQFKYNSPTVNYNFTQKKLIQSHSTRLNFVSRLLNELPNIKLWDNDYWKFFNSRNSSSYEWNDIYFGNNITSYNILNELYENPNYFLKYKNFFKEKLISINKKYDDLSFYSNKTPINILLSKFKNSIADDLEYDIDLVKVIKKEEIMNNKLYSLIFTNYDITMKPSWFYQSGVMILKIKTWLKYKDSKSDVPIEEYFAMMPTIK